MFPSGTLARYNGSIQYFLADLAPSFPCHLSYEQSQTWFDMANNTSNWVGIAKVLDGLANAGFNGIRLPMFPENDWIKGPSPFNNAQKVDWK